MSQIPDTLVPAREGDYLMITTSSGYWAKGDSITAAKAKLREVCGRTTAKGWRVRSVHPDAGVNGDGGVFGPKGHPPLVTAEYDKG